MTKINCLNPISKTGLDLFTADYEIVDKIDDADAVLVRSASMHDMELPKSLKAVARAGAGVNNIPLDKCAEKGIVVFNTPGANANGVKELVIAGMLLAARDVVGGIEWVKSAKDDADIAKTAEKQKKNFAGGEIEGKKLGVIGLGAIGVKVANAAVSMGMDVYGYDPYISVAGAWNLSRSVKHIATTEQIFKECDYITIHVPLLDSTKGMINKEAFDMMKDGVVVLNFARDILVDEEAMAEALKSGKVRKYVTDFPNPLSVNMENAIVTPHIGASTEESEDNCAVMAVNEIMDFIENGNIKNSVNYPNCDMGVCDKTARIAIFHKNKPNMIGQFTTVMAKDQINISDMTDKSKGDYAYLLMDLDTAVTDKVIADIEAIEGVIGIRVIK
ncbi:MAG: phosphoglycerate dehydrogenase [Lachnospiraceae bacterium]|nr:phosphoglycerate dehydrogenase [Lachnospiraceae bacterium]MDE6254198.1 phosphoglycerate dehydrogenase [Lachnospiraceae bacterium]